MAQPVKLPPAVLASHVGTGSGPSCSTFKPAPRYCAWKSSRERLKDAGVCAPWENWQVYQAPGFGSAQPYQCSH